MLILQGNSYSIAQKSGEIWTGQADLQPISFKFDRLLDQAALEAVWKWRFTPARRGNQSIAAWVEVPITFKLEN